MACEIVSPLPAVLDHWEEGGSDGGFRRDTTGNYVLKVILLCFQGMCSHMVAFGNCSGVDLVAWDFKTLIHLDQTLT